MPNKQKSDLNNLFAYGLLKSEKVQQALFGKNLKTKKCELPNHALYEAEDGFYFISAADNEIVHGRLLELSNFDLKICDAFECCPTMYQRIKVNVLIDNKEVDCFVYIRVDDVGKSVKIDNHDKTSRLNKVELIAEIKKFKEVEHPEFYK